MTTSPGCSQPNDSILTERTNTQMQSLRTKGIYTLIIFLSKNTHLNVGQLGSNELHKGYYTYTGSAMGRGNTSLKARLSRHLRKQKRKHWHIDYLLSVQHAKIAGVVAAETEEKMECTTNRHLEETEEVEIPVRGFGASDCKDTCASHLLYFPRINEAPTLVKKVMKCYRDFDLSPMPSPIPTPAFEASTRQAFLKTAKNSSD